MEYTIIDKKNINEVRKEIDRISKSNKLEEITVIAGDSDFNRKILENKKVNVLLFLDFNGRDKLKQRDSGLDHVLCRLAKENNITIGFDLSFLKDKSDLVISQKASRLAQNIKLCNKFGNIVRIFNYSNSEIIKLKAFLLSLGMNNKTIQGAF
ncbi:MAG: hypothetical protein AABW91_00360 [Nanoarchaeota archaeon]